MAWIRVDDLMSTHPKIVAAGPEAAWLFVCGLGYASRQLTDGFIPSAALPLLSTVKHPNAAAQVLVRVGLWEREEGGYRIHDYLDYQPSAVEVRATRRSDRLRKSPRIPAGIRGPVAPDSGDLPAGFRPSRARTSQTHPGPIPSRTRKATPVGESPSKTNGAGAPNVGVAHANGVSSGNGDAASLEALLQAFDDRHLERPPLVGFEAKHARDLLKYFPPGEIAQCWQDFASGDYAEIRGRAPLSFQTLTERNRMGNWRRERENQRELEQELVGHIVVERA